MAEISEEGDKPDDVIKKEGEGEVEQVVVEEKTDEVVAVETPSTAKDEVTNDVCVIIIILSYREVWLTLESKMFDQNTPCDCLTQEKRLACNNVVENRPEQYFAAHIAPGC